MTTTTKPSADRQALLGAFIRAHRERLPAPAKSRGRRRTPGWRREELADAVGIGATWLTWLEQGREVNASAAVLARLAQALRLSPAERAALFELADRRDPEFAPAEDGELPAELLALPGHMDTPAYVLDHTWNARAWNAQAAELFVGWLDDAAIERNLLRYVFESSLARDLIADWSERARRLVAEFRADFNHHLDDPAMHSLVETLIAHSEDFAQCWHAQDVLYREGGLRVFIHPRLGRCEYHQTTLLVASQPTVKLVCLS
jgi:transcriptional regulator with XRE-family HTH domain